MKRTDLNIANSIFEGFNDQHGLMICGYEWGESKADQVREGTGEETKISFDTECTFSNKVPRYGDAALTWPYDKRLKKWFELWGFPLNSNGLGDDFDKSLIQTNWSDTQNQVMTHYHELSSNPERFNNFIRHIEALRPRVILFMGSQLIRHLQRPHILEKFTAIMGNVVTPLHFLQKDLPYRRFKIGFQSFEQCEVICFPHPSGSTGIADAYIAAFKPEMNEILSQYISQRNFKNP